MKRVTFTISDLKVVGVLSLVMPHVHTLIVDDIPEPEERVRLEAPPPLPRKPPVKHKTKLRVPPPIISSVERREALMLLLRQKPLITAKDITDQGKVMGENPAHLRNVLYSMIKAGQVRRTVTASGDFMYALVEPQGDLLTMQG